MNKLLLFADLRREPNRKRMKGLVRYFKEHGEWEFYFPPQTMHGYPDKDMMLKNIITFANEIKPDVIYELFPENIITETAQLGIPVLLDSSRMNPDSAISLNKKDTIGEMAANFFIQRHYSNFAFLGYSYFVWSRERELSFVETVKKANGTVSVYNISDSIPNCAEIKQWIQGLPPSTALYAANDVLAKLVTEICRTIEKQIPQSLTVLGTDNDEFLCTTASPMISSIQLDFEGQGYELGRNMERAIKNQCMNQFKIYPEPIGIIERDSTKHHNISDKYVAKLVDYMDKHYTNNLQLNKFIEQIPMSRRSLEMKFSKEMEGSTILRYLTNLRIEHMKRLLANPDMRISDVVYQSGFDDILNISRIFKKYTGYTPTDYRKQLFLQSMNKQGI